MTYQEIKEHDVTFKASLVYYGVSPFVQIKVYGKNGYPTVYSIPAEDFDGELEALLKNGRKWADGKAMALKRHYSLQPVEDAIAKAQDVCWLLEEAIQNNAYPNNYDVLMDARDIEEMSR